MAWAWPVDASSSGASVGTNGWSPPGVGGGVGRAVSGSSSSEVTSGSNRLRGRGPSPFGGSIATDLGVGSELRTTSGSPESTNVGSNGPSAEGSG
ncbi:hypothetical protein K7G98_21160 [Saccharothrix sp. MB29]|nr:hypothetical protein [Saccharothrix sp. MB29]